MGATYDPDRVPTPLVKSKRSLRPLPIGAPRLAGTAAAGGVTKLGPPIWKERQAVRGRHPMQGHQGPGMSTAT